MLGSNEIEIDYTLNRMYSYYFQSVTMFLISNVGTVVSKYNG